MLQKKKKIIKCKKVSMSKKHTSCFLFQVDAAVHAEGGISFRSKKVSKTWEVGDCMLIVTFKTISFRLKLK